MKYREQELLFKLTEADTNKEDIKCLLEENIDYPWLLGQILFNRLGGVVYSKLVKCEFLGKVNREFRNSLKYIFQMQKLKTESFLRGLNEISTIFSSATFQYAFLKGSFLNSQLYEVGQRTSNDYDILVSQRDLDSVHELLSENGFVQGKYDFNSMELMKVSRSDIISARMNRGETIPYFKKTNDPHIEYIEIDVNFSLDYKAQGIGDNVEMMLRNAIQFETDKQPLYTLEKNDFLIHLCLHLYKEATVYNWVKMQRDLSLYKFLDIVRFYKHYKQDSEFVKSLIDKIRYYGVQKECYYTFYNTAILYPDILESDNYKMLLLEIKPMSKDYLKQIVYPEQNKVFCYDMDFRKWFFTYDRIEHLMPIENTILE